MRSTESGVAGTVAGLILVTRSLAGGAGENAILIIDPSDPVSMWVGNHYKAARQIPDANVLYMRPGATDYQAFQDVNLAALAGSVASRRLSDHADFIVVAPTAEFFVSAPGYFTDSCFPINRFSLSSAYSSAFITADINARNNTQSYANRYWSTANSAVGFDSNTTWLSGAASTQPTARRYYIGGLIGYTGVRGNTAAELISMIDRTVAIEGTRPAGTIFLMNNTDDPARNVRASQFNAVLNTITTNLDRQAEIVQGKIPWGRNDVLGVVSGWPDTQLLESNITILPGAYCEHLTSWACTFDIADQVKASAWITKGASGSAGAVEEPCNYPSKFNHSRFHVYYLQGQTMAEAYFRSLQSFPLQNLLIGDVLARPFAFIPMVADPNLPVAPVSGTISIPAQATTAASRVTIAGLDLLVDGVFHSTVANNGTFSLNTSGLDDGWHEIRLVAFDSTLNRVTGRFVGSIVTNNHGHTAGLTGPGGSPDLGTTLTFASAGSGASVLESQLLHNGRVIASRVGAGPMSVMGSTLGAGASTVLARVLFANGKSAWSAPVAVTVSPNSGTPAPRTPTAFSYTKKASAGDTVIVELPAVFNEAPGTAAFALTAAPSRSALVGGSGPYRVLRPNSAAITHDVIEFTVTTASGTSAPARVSIEYGPHCPSDFNFDGFVDGFDYDDFVQCFEGGPCPPLQTADFNADGFADGFDYDTFVESFELGCS